VKIGTLAERTLIIFGETPPDKELHMVAFSFGGGYAELITYDDGFESTATTMTSFEAASAVLLFHAMEPNHTGVGIDLGIIRWILHRSEFNLGPQVAEELRALLDSATIPAEA